MDRCHFALVPAKSRDLLTELQLGGLRLTRSTHPASTVIPKHAHRLATVNILVDGSFEELYPRRRAIHCSATSVLVRPPGADHLDKLGQAGACNLVLELDDTRLESIQRHSSVFDAVQILDNAQTLRAVQGIRRELQIQDGATAMAVEGLALELLTALSRGRRDGDAAPSPWLRRVTEALHDRFQDPGLKFQDLAREAGVHPVSMNRAFRKLHGQSPGQYLRDLRVRWAEEQIRTTTLPLSSIAFDAGFADQSHLSRVFKAQMGCTPAVWRRQHRDA